MLCPVIFLARSETTRYMIAGYSVIFGVMFIYIISLIVRFRNLKRDMDTLNQLDGQEK